MRLNGRETALLLLAFFLTGCSDPLIDFTPLKVVDTLTFCSSRPFQNYTYSDALFYSISDKNTFDAINEKHNLRQYCSNIDKFDDDYFSDALLLMFFNSFVGNLAIGSEMTNDLVTYHFYYPNGRDQVFVYFCYTTIIAKDSFAGDPEELRFKVETHILNYDEFASLQDNEMLTYF